MGRKPRSTKWIKGITRCSSSVPRLLEWDTADEVGARLLQKGHHPAPVLPTRGERRRPERGASHTTRSGPGPSRRAVCHTNRLAAPARSTAARGRRVRRARRTMAAVASSEWSSSTTTSSSTPLLASAASTAACIVCSSLRAGIRTDTRGSELPGSRRRWRLIRGQVSPEQQCRNGGQDQCDQRQEHQESRSPLSGPCSARKRSPRTPGRDCRHRS